MLTAHFIANIEKNPIVSSTTAAVVTSTAVKKITNQTSFAQSAQKPKGQQNLNGKTSTSADEDIDMVKFTEEIAVARQQMESNDLNEVDQGYITIAAFLEGPDTIYRRMTIELIGSEKLFYKNYDAVLEELSDISLSDAVQILNTVGYLMDAAGNINEHVVSQLTHNQKCVISRSLDEFSPFSLRRIHFRTFDHIRDDLSNELLEKYARAWKLSKNLTDRKRPCLLDDSAPTP